MKNSSTQLSKPSKAFHIKYIVQVDEIELNEMKWITYRGDKFGAFLIEQRRGREKSGLGFWIKIGLDSKKGIQQGRAGLFGTETAWGRSHRSNRGFWPSPTRRGKLLPRDNRPAIGSGDDTPTPAAAPPGLGGGTLVGPGVAARTRPVRSCRCLNMSR